MGLILPAVRGWFGDLKGQVIALIKPQFEAGREAAAAHAGVIKDDTVHRQVLQKILEEVREFGFWPVGLIPSPIKGPKGNVEFLVDLRLEQPGQPMDLDEMIGSAIQQKP